MTTALLAVAIATAPPAASSTRSPAWRYLDADIHRAINYAGRAWNVSPSWLHNCIHTEGGHGRFFVSNSGYQDSGWFQFLPGTFASFSPSAWAAGYKLGPSKTPPLKYRRIDSRLGQAWTAAWAFHAGLSYHWYGSGC